MATSSNSSNSSPPYQCTVISRTRRGVVDVAVLVTAGPVIVVTSMPLVLVMADSGLVTAVIILVPVVVLSPSVRNSRIAWVRRAASSKPLADIIAFLYRAIFFDPGEDDMFFFLFATITHT